AVTPVSWQNTLRAREQTGMAQISGSVLVVALFRAFPDHEALLAHLKLSDDDLVRGVQWQQHLRNLVAQHTKPSRTDGIARDWSLGYIPLLARCVQNMRERIARGGLLSSDLEAHTDALEQMVSTLVDAGWQNIALVAPAGVGKTTIVHAFAERL